PYVRALETLLKTAPPSGTVSSDSPRAVVDRRTFSGDLDNQKSTFAGSRNAADVRESGPFEPVFGVVEDLIIHFKDEASNELFESVIQSYKNGTYPVRA